MPMLEAFHVQVRYLDCAASEGVSPTLVELYATASKAETKQEEVKLTGKRFVETKFYPLFIHLYPASEESFRTLKT